jgi:arsenate reductase
MFNTSGKEYRDQNLKEKLAGMSDNDCFALLAGNGRLIKRPLVTDDTRATVGFQEDLFQKTWG